VGYDGRVTRSDIRSEESPRIEVRVEGLRGRGGSALSSVQNVGPEADERRFHKEIILLTINNRESLGGRGGFGGAAQLDSACVTPSAVRPDLSLSGIRFMVRTQPPAAPAIPSRRWRDSGSRGTRAALRMQPAAGLKVTEQRRAPE
jgi:hypothetical protein